MRRRYSLLEEAGHLACAVKYLFRSLTAHARAVATSYASFRNYAGLAIGDPDRFCRAFTHTCVTYPAPLLYRLHKTGNLHMSPPAASQPQTPLNVTKAKSRFTAIVAVFVAAAGLLRSDLNRSQVPPAAYAALQLSTVPAGQAYPGSYPLSSRTALPGAGSQTKLPLPPSRQ